MNTPGLGDSIQYGAIITKVRALYGRRLTGADYRAVMGMRTIPEVAAFLSEHAGYAHLMIDLPKDVRRNDLERTLRREIHLEYERIYRFMSREDHPLIGLIIKKAELAAIFDYLRSLSAGRTDRFSPNLSPFIKNHISIDFEALKATSAFSEGLPFFGDSIYKDVFSELPKDRYGGLNYLAAEGALLARYYTHAVKIVKKHYPGETGRFIEQILLREVELFNLTALLRMKKYFPDMVSDLTAALIPLGARIRVSMRKEFLEAKEPETILRLLSEERPFKKLLSARSGTDFSDLLLEYGYSENRKILRRGTPGPYVPIAYLALKEIEIKNLIRLVERIRYDVSRESSPFFPIGAETEHA